MPGKHNAGGCGCCGGCDWPCGTTPDTVAVVGGAGCCAYPNGTFSVGATSGGGLTASNGVRYNESTNSFEFPGPYDCNWYWSHDPLLGEVCKTTAPYYQASTGTIDHMVVCQTEDYLDASSNVIGVYRVRLMGGPSVNLQWRQGVRVWCVIARVYQCLRCTAGGGTLNPAFALSTIDIYNATGLACGSLPATINHSSRISNWTNYANSTTGTTDSLSFGYNPATGLEDKYTFTACAANASVAVTYA